MLPPTDEKADGHPATFPRFEHGEDLWIVSWPDDQVEFRTDVRGESISADNAVFLRDTV